ncbi:hypothetical protein DF186_21835, partial [Enterococcus hirae]
GPAHSEGGPSDATRSLATVRKASRRVMALRLPPTPTVLSVEDLHQVVQFGTKLIGVDEVAA